MKLSFWSNCHFVTLQCLIAIRPYCNREENESWCGGSPLFVVLFGLFLVLFVLLSGRLHRRGDCNNYSRSPLCVFLLLVCTLLFNSDDGEIHRRGDYKWYSRSPLCFGLSIGFVDRMVFKMTGRFTGRRDSFQLSFSPLWTEKSCVF